MIDTSIRKMRFIEPEKSHEEYVKAHKKSNLQTGDRVKSLRDNGFVPFGLCGYVNKEENNGYWILWDTGEIWHQSTHDLVKIDGHQPHFENKFKPFETVRFIGETYYIKNGSLGVVQFNNSNLGYHNYIIEFKPECNPHGTSKGKYTIALFEWLIEKL